VVAGAGGGARAGRLGDRVGEGAPVRRVAARYLLLLVVLAASGSLIDRFPFGPSNGSSHDPLFSVGGRYALWMVPALAFGLAALAHRAYRTAARREPMRLVLDAVLVLGAIAIVVAGYEPAPEAPFPGSESATGFIDASLGSDDVAIVTGSGTFSFAVSTTTPVGVQATPDHEVGFAPTFLDRRVKNVGGWAAAPGSPADIRSWTADADRVLVMTSGPLGGYQDVQVVARRGRIHAVRGQAVRLGLRRDLPASSSATLRVHPAVTLRVPGAGTLRG
jgi:hypothetical protein